MRWIQFSIQFLLDVESLPSSVTSRGNATLTTYNALHNQSEKSSRFPPEEAWGDRERSRKRSRDGGRVAGRPGRVAVGPLQRLASTTSLCSAPSRRHVAQRKISSSLQTEAEGTLGNLTSANKHAAFFFILQAKKKMHLVLISKLSLNLKNVGAGIVLRHTL